MAHGDRMYPGFDTFHKSQKCHSRSLLRSQILTPLRVWSGHGKVQPYFSFRGKDFLYNQTLSLSWTLLNQTLLKRTLRSLILLRKRVLKLLCPRKVAHWVTLITRRHLLRAQGRSRKWRDCRRTKKRYLHLRSGWRREEETSSNRKEGNTYTYQTPTNLSNWKDDAGREQGTNPEEPRRVQARTSSSSSLYSPLPSLLARVPTTMTGVSYLCKPQTAMIEASILPK